MCEPIFMDLFGTFKCRKVIMHECWRGPCLNILSAEMSSHLNLENWTKDEAVWWRGNWTKCWWERKFCNRKFPFNTPPPEFWCPLFALVIMQIWKKSLGFQFTSVGENKKISLVQLSTLKHFDPPVLKHLCMVPFTTQFKNDDLSVLKTSMQWSPWQNIQAFSLYPRSHLCVVLHFLGCGLFQWILTVYTKQVLHTSIGECYEKRNSIAHKNLHTNQ